MFEECGVADVRLGNFGAAEDPVDRVSRRNAVICYEELGGIMVDTYLRGQSSQGG